MLGRGDTANTIKVRNDFVFMWVYRYSRSRVKTRGIQLLFFSVFRQLNVMSWYGYWWGVKTEKH